MGSHAARQPPSDPGPPPGIQAPAGAPGTWRHRPELDGLRALAVVTIVFFHAQVAGAASSFIVLDLFFVLSGFLVTGVVLHEIDVRGELRLGRYYARRVRRLLPAAVVAIVGTALVFLLVASEPERLEMLRQAQAAAVYLANWQFIADGADYFAGDIRSSPFMHFWSLSVEEQYYIVFPLLVLAWWRLAPGRQRVLLGWLGAGIALSLASQLYWGAADPTRAYFATDARLFQLLAGAALAVAIREFATPAREGGVSWPRAGAALATAGLVGYVVLGSELIGMSVSHRNVLATLLAGALVVGVYTGPGSWVARGCALPWLTYLGTISYGIYLWHWPVVLLAERLLDVRPLVVALLALVLATALASASYQLLETPIRRGRVLDRFHWPVVGAGVTASVLVAVLVVPPVLTSQRTPAVTAAAQSASDPAADGATARALAAPVPAGLDYEALAADEGPVEALCSPDDLDGCRVVREGDGPHVVLVGDSHAKMLSGALEPLAREQGFRLSASVVPTCPWEDGVGNRRASPQNRERCQEAQSAFYEETLPALEPDVVVLSAFPRSGNQWRKALDLRDGEDGVDEPRTVLREAVDRTLDRIEERTGARVLIVKSMFGTDGWRARGPDPLDCLARAESLGECVVDPPPDQPAVDGFYDTAAASRPEVETVDLTPVVCPDHPRCLPVVDGQVVWRHSNHVAGSYLAHRRDQVWELLVEAGFPARSG